MNIEPDSLIDSLQGIIFDQTQRMTPMFKAMGMTGILDGEEFIASMRADRRYDSIAEDLLRGRADALERWFNDMDSASSPPVFSVIDGDRED
ncbi:hypothetical protein [Brevundimonas aurantiaca]|uniref:hypothetical protein n=1 Tax=Brevundimonas aurantiaca TaxID=74316 RepID=UPI00174EC5C1|nr:hypothetical protein [Brevundimonas aurantiaca]